MRSRIGFYALSFSWGLPMTIVGCLAALVLMAVGFRPKRYGCCALFEVGHGWGGVSLGVVIITARNMSEKTRAHEHGHALQNCVFGVLMPVLVCVPSAVRYWFRSVTRRTDPPYDGIWFEGQATQWGTEFMENAKAQREKAVGK